MPKITHFEIFAKDVKKIMQFYENTFGWQFKKWEGPTEYWLIKTGDEKEPGIDGGFEKKRPKFEGTINTIEVTNLDDTIKKIIKNKGTIIVPKFAVFGVGWMVYFKDPEGTAFGVLQSDPTAK